MIAGNVKHGERPIRAAPGAREHMPWLRQALKVGCGAVIEIASHKDDVRLQGRDLPHHALDKPMIAYVPQMKIAHQRCFSPAPLCREVRQGNRDSDYAWQCRIT